MDPRGVTLEVDISGMTGGRAAVDVRVGNVPVAAKYVGWRCLHEAEGGYDSDSSGMPEIRPGIKLDGTNVSHSPPPINMVEAIQWLSWDMMNKPDSPGYNSLFTKNNRRVVYDTYTAFCNGQGYSTNPDRKDFVTPQDVNNQEYPKLMKGIICGGMFLLDDGYDDQYIYASPGVSAIPANGPYPTYLQVFERHWYFEATTQKNGKMSHFPQGHGAPVWIPYVLREKIKYPRSWFQRWEEDFLPDPLAFYLPTVPVNGE